MSNSSLVVVNTTNSTISSLSFIQKHTFHASYYIFNHKYGAIISNISLVLIALSIIFSASNASLSRPKSAPKLHKSHPDYLNLKTHNGSQDSDKLINEHYAIMMPVLCTIGLVSIYYSLKVVDKSTISWAFNHYTLLFSIFAFLEFFQFAYKVTVMKFQRLGWDLTEQLPRFRLTLTQEDEILAGSDFVVNELYEDRHGEKPFIDHIEEDFEPPSKIKSKSQLWNLYISSIDIFSLITAAGLSFIYWKSQKSPNWIFSNFVAWCFAFEGILRLHLSSFKVGVIILTGLFFYDIYFVFKTDIMITVATSIEVPMMMRLPSGQNYQNITIDPSLDYLVPKLPFSMLGLGDIAIPGAFIAMCLRYDLYKFHKHNPDIQFDYLNSFSRGYFNVGVSSYILGLSLTFLALKISDSAQPALLYLSPSLIFGIIGYGWWRGELKELYQYSEIDEEEQKRRERFKKKKELQKKREKGEIVEDDEDDDEEDDEDYEVSSSDESDDDILDDEEFSDEELIVSDEDEVEQIERQEFES